MTRLRMWNHYLQELNTMLHNLQMTMNELLQLNDTDLEDMFGRSESGSLGQRDTFSSGWSGPIHASQYIWVLRFNEVGGETEGIINISFQVIIRAM